MFAGIADDIGHARLAPACIDLLVASLAGSRSDIMSVIGRHCRRNGGRKRGGCLRRHRRHLRQMPDEAHELPDLAVGQIPGRHAGVTDAVADVVKYFSVRSCRDRRRAQCRHAREFLGADHGLATAVVAVAGFALLLEKVFSSSDVGRISRWIDADPGPEWNTLMQQPGRENRLGRRRFGARARQPRNDFSVKNAEDGSRRHGNERTPDQELSAHRSRPRVVLVCRFAAAPSSARGSVVPFASPRTISQPFALAVLSSAARSPLASFVASSTAQKCKKMPGLLNQHVTMHCRDVDAIRT